MTVCSFCFQIVIMRRRNHCNIQLHPRRNEVATRFKNYSRSSACSSRVYQRSTTDMLAKVTLLLVLLPHMAQTKYTSRGKSFRYTKNAYLGWISTLSGFLNEKYGPCYQRVPFTPVNCSNQSHNAFFIIKSFDKCVQRWTNRISENRTLVCKVNTLKRT